MTIRKTDLIIPSDEEDARINTGIALDEDNPELTEEQFTQLRPFSEVFPDLARAMKYGITYRPRLANAHE